MNLSTSEIGAPKPFVSFMNRDMLRRERIKKVINRNCKRDIKLVEGQYQSIVKSPPKNMLCLN